LSDAWLDAAQDQLTHDDPVGGAIGDNSRADIRHNRIQNNSIHDDHIRTDSIHDDRAQGDSARDDSARDDSGLEDVATPTDFGRELSALWTRRGLSMRRAARLAELPHSTLHDWSKGRVPQDAEQVAGLMRVLRVCGVTSPAELARWRSALNRARRQPGRKPGGEVPYRGLASFGQGDAKWFFGREDVADHLASLLADEDAPDGKPGPDGGDPGGLPLVLVGPSGAGKSSLLCAGLLPRLGGPAVVFEPTAEPVTALKAALAELRDAGGTVDGGTVDGGTVDGGGAGRPTIIVDQFEAVFTECPDEAHRREFVAMLCDLSRARTAHVVLALRADFYDHAIRQAELARALQHRQVVLSPMSAADVRRVITEPARLAKVDVESGLVSLLLADLNPRDGRQAAGGGDPQDAGAYEAGALPLLSHALLATWENRSGAALTVAGYLASGRIRDAVARTAEAAYAALTEAEQQLARRLFLRLVHVGDDAPPVRAVVSLGELREWGGDADAGRVLGVFVDQRLITVGAVTAQITHDALITAWPRLQSWIDAGQAGLITRRRITDAARAWEAAGREDTWLWRGGQLAIASEYAVDPDNRGSLTRMAGEFVDASSTAELARRAANRRRTRILQALVAVLTVLVVIVGLTATYAFSQRHDAVVASDNANSREIALIADQVRGQDPALAAQLSVASYAMARTPQATAAVLESSGTPSAARILDTPSLVQWAAVSPDRRLIAAAGADGTLKLWNVAGPGRPRLVATVVPPDSDHPLYVAQFSPDGSVLAAAGAGRVVRRWNVRDPARPVPLPTLTGPASTIYSVAFSPGGTTIAAGSYDDKAWLWDVRDPARPVAARRPLSGASGAVESVAFSPDGRTLAAGGADDAVRLWALTGVSGTGASGTGASGTVPASTVPAATLAATLKGPAATVSGVAFSPDGHELAASSQDSKVWLWKLSPGKGVFPAVSATPDGSLRNATTWANAVAFSPDGATLAAGTSDADVLVWNLASRALTSRLPEPQPVTSVTWDGTDRIAASDADGTATIWTVPTPVLLAGNAASAVAYGPDGEVIAVGGTSVQLWDATSHARIATRALPPNVFVNGMAWAADGKYLAAAISDGTVLLLDGATLAPLGPAFTVTATGTAETVSFAPDGTTLATGADDGTVRLWSLADPAHPAPLATARDSGTYVYTVTYAPDGKTLAAASTDDVTRLWNVANPAAPVPAGRPLTGLRKYAIGLAFSPDSALLAVGSADGTVHLWNVADPERAVPAAAPLAGPASYVWALAFSPDGKTLAAGVTDGTVWLWNVTSPAAPSLIASLSGVTGHIYSISFTPAGDKLAASSNDGSVHIWDTSPLAARAAVCGGLGLPLSAQEWADHIPGIPYQVPCAP
jgi:WD40 repeat protein